MMRPPFVRTVLGDVRAADLGVTYAHEHLVIDGGRPVEMSKDFLLADVDRLGEELAAARSAGLEAAVDMMRPADRGDGASPREVLRADALEHACDGGRARRPVRCRCPRWHR
jgi:predicted metal-dependent phosphotriesterase family hydrolase